MHFKANPQAQAQGGAAPAGADANSYAAPAAGGGDNYGHLPPMQKKIMEIVSADSSGEGMHVKHVGRMCGAVNSEEVMEAIEQLMGEGLLYSTIDDLVSSWERDGKADISTSRRRPNPLGDPCVIEAVKKRVYDVDMSVRVETEDIRSWDRGPTSGS